MSKVILTKILYLALVAMLYLTSAYMVVHAEGLAGIELHYTAQLTIPYYRPFSQSEALRTAAITFPLPNHPYPLSVNLLPMFPPLLTTTTSVLMRM